MLRHRPAALPVKVQDTVSPLDSRHLAVRPPSLVDQGARQARRPTPKVRLETPAPKGPKDAWNAMM